ncbi:MAG: RNA polymerase sigma factor [Actinomycetes bacterium]
MKFKAKAPVAAGNHLAVSEWSIAELSALYAEQRSSLTAQARRILRNQADGDEIVQEAFLKFILAAPELDSRERALAYLRTTVNNLCLNQIRATGSRPNLVAIDSETSQEAINEISAASHVPFDTNMAAAEDASIIREALARLSSDQRTALVMWEMEGRSTEEIAEAIGTTPANVRHVVQRARASFVRVLATWVVDEETGATALDSLSTSYKKAAELAKKSSKVALSLLLVLVAFLGFNSITGNEVTKTNTLTTISAPVQQEANTAVAPTASAASTATSDLLNKSTQLLGGVSAKTNPFTFPGLDSDGIPTGFTATDGIHTGKVYVAQNAPVVTIDGTKLTITTMSQDANAVNVLLDQTLSVSALGTDFTADPTVTINKSWVPLNVSTAHTDITRLPDGNYLVTSVIDIDSAVDTGTIVPVSRGFDVSSAPSTITTRLVLNPGKTKVLAQAVYVQTKGAK